MSRKILNQLLDKFERSKQKENIHISVRVTKQTLPEYFDLNSEEYEEINKELQELEQQDLISLDWKANRPGHIIERVRLVPENSDQLYQLLNRKPKRDQIAKIKLNLKRELEKYSDSEITNKFINYLITCLEKNRSVSEYLDFNNYSEFKSFVSTLFQIEKNEELLYLREFSGKATGNTKYIENNLSKFINVIFKFSELFDSKDSELILNYFNIFRNPIFIFLKGNVTIQINSQIIDLTQLTNGIAISSQDLKNLKIKGLTTLITIENLTTYNRFLTNKGELIVYSRGFANSELIRLLQRIQNDNKNCHFYHFGDIDVGGFLILIDLIQKTGETFTPIFMNSKTLENNKKFSKPLTINDKKRLKNLIEAIPNFELEEKIKEEILETLIFIQQSGIKLEQEVIDFNNDLISQALNVI